MKKRHTKLPRWQKLPVSELHMAEAFLKSREKFCVSASARFRKIKESKDTVWYIPGSGSEISAIILQSGQTLFPVFNGNTGIPEPLFLRRFLYKVHVHAAQGLREDAELLEALMEGLGYYASERVDYALMGLDGEPRPEALRAGPMGLILRPPVAGDEDGLFALQSAYEKEEVLPKNADFSPAACRLNLQNIISSERLLVAELDGQVVGKINTSAESFTRYQIGGVYVRPDCRGRRIAEKMTAFISRDLVAGGKGVTLFVKKHNDAALKVYLRAGFNTLADYRITYF